MKKFLSILTFLIVANATFAAITFTPTAIDSGYCKQTYYCKITATGGTAPYAYTVTSGSLPSGLTLNKTSGVLSGILNYTEATSVTFTVQAKDKKNVTATKVYTMYITNQEVGWSDIVTYWQNIPNTFPDFGKIYNTWRLNTPESFASSFWSLSGNSLTGTGIFGSTSNQDLSIKTNDTERIRIKNSGFIGIGTSSPLANLDVRGSFKYDDNNTDSSKYLMDTGGGVGQWTTPDWIRKTGLNGINVESPTSAFDVKGSGSNYANAFSFSRPDGTNILSAFNIGQISIGSSGANQSYFDNHRLSLNGNALYSGGSALSIHSEPYIYAVAVANNVDSVTFSIDNDGNIRMPKIPSDSTGLTKGSIYISSGTLKIKY